MGGDPGPLEEVRGPLQARMDLVRQMSGLRAGTMLPTAEMAITTAQQLYSDLREEPGCS